MQWQEHKKCSSPSLPNPTKSNKCLWGRREEEQRITQQMELQDQDLQGSPRLEEGWIGGNVDLDLFSFFPQRYARIMRGIERKANISKVNNGAKRGEKRA